MRNLIVDIGNSRAKISVIRDNELLLSEAFDALDTVAWGKIGEWVATYETSRAIVSSTRGDGEEVSGVLRKMVEEVILFGSETPIPIANSYATPETLGRDRLAAAVGAWSIYGESYDILLVVDLGSAITFDLVTREGGFEGGTISPGVEMRFRSLHEFTANLPLCTSTDEIVEVARTTKEAIEQGVMMGIAYEIEGYISHFIKKSDKIAIIFTGGDAKKLAKRVKNPIFAESELVVMGLNKILSYNAK